MLCVVVAGGCSSGSGAAHDGGNDVPASNDGSQLDGGPQDTSTQDGSPQDLVPDVAQDVGDSDARDDLPVTTDAGDASNADADGDDASDGGRDATGDTPPPVATWDSPTSIWDQSLWN